jgi:hypothetical protein
MDLSTADDEISSQKLLESSQFWNQLFGRAFLYRHNPEDAACRDFTLHDVPTFDIPFTPTEKISQPMASQRLEDPPPSTYAQPPDILYAEGNAEWRVVSTSSSTTDIEGRSRIYMLLGVTSDLIEEVKLENDFPASTPSIPTACSIDEIIRQCTSLGIGPEKVQRARAALDNSNDNHLAVLTIAWTYILSALWGESQGGTAQFLHVAPEVRERPCEDHQVVYVPGEDSGAVNWWQRLLAQPSGWEVTMEYRKTAYHSPWNIRIPQGAVSFRVLSQAAPKAGILKPPDAATALEYLARYCAFHGLTKQAETALAAALVLPTHIHVFGVKVNLPKPVHAVDVFAVGSSGEPRQTNQELPLLRLLPQLPHLMTISASGIKNLLLGAFYNPEVPSTLCGEWYRPATSAWPASTAHAAVIGCLRSPTLSRWWIGAGVTSFILPRVIRNHCCMWHTDLHLALWTGSSRLSPHSHLCRILTEDGVTLHTITEAGTRLVLRADEILAAFMSSAIGPQKMFLHIPPAPFHPPGYAELDKSSLQIIRIAEAGVALRLQFVNCAWETTGEAAKKLTSYPMTEPTPLSHSNLGKIPAWEMPVDESLIRSAQSASENVTRSIMDWICGYRGTEADQNRGDLDLDRLFAAYDD